MKIVITAALAATALSSAAAAGNTNPPVIAASAPVAASIVDWSGPYTGASFSLKTGRQDYYSGGSLTVYDAMEGQHYGVFAGYNIQNGGLVYGGELAYSMGHYFDGPL